MIRAKRRTIINTSSDEKWIFGISDLFSVGLWKNSKEGMRRKTKTSWSDKTIRRSIRGAMVNNIRTQRNRKPKNGLSDLSKKVKCLHIALTNEKTYNIKARKPTADDLKHTMFNPNIEAAKTNKSRFFKSMIMRRSIETNFYKLQN